MRKILFYIYSLEKGGAERVLLTVTEKLNKDNDLEIVILTDIQGEKEYAMPEGIRRVCLCDYLIKSPLAKLNSVSRLIAIRRCICSERPDQVVAFMVSAGIRSIFALFGTGYKVTVAVRANPFDDFTIHMSREKLCRLFARSKAIVCQTREQIGYFKGIENKCYVIANPIFTNFCVEPFRGERRKEIVTTGRLYDYKNQKLLINAFANVASEYPDYKLIIWGEGPYRAELEKEIIELDGCYTGQNLSERILLPGESSMVAEDIKESAIYVLPSNTEGMPNALMEAMALGIPCISTDCPGGGPASIIDNGINGILVPMNDIGAMTEALRKLLDDGELRDRLGSKALEIREKCNAEKIADEWKKVILG